MMDIHQLLDKVESPKDIKDLDLNQLYQLSKELRDFILNSVSQTGGHLSSNLGCIELTIALHYVYDTPNDLLVWDVGHQSYPHKILTGRKDRMSTLRKYKGLAGFPKREESIYDTFGVGHSSTSISAGLGMAIANKIKGINNKTVAIIGDGSMTSGLAFEGLNNAGWLKSDMLVILNDNEMSISENVGAISQYLSRILTSRFYNSVKQKANQALSIMPELKKIAHRVEEHVKGMLTPGTMFEEFGFNYIGPIDGHDLEELVSTLKDIRNLKGPQFLHVVTKKGYGYKLAESNPIGYHGVTNFNPNEGLIGNQISNSMTYTQVFGKWLCDWAKFETNFVAITPAMREGSGMVEFAKKYPDMFFDVGIAEQHAITFAAGLATQGVKPIVAIYSTFLQRGYDQLIHDVAIQNLPIIFALDRAGIVGPDGPTHIGAFDLSYMNCIPNMVILAPSNENECYHMFSFAYGLNCPVAIRYPRGNSLGIGINQEDNLDIKLGNAKNIHQGFKVAILGFGTLLNQITDYCIQNNFTLYDMRFIKPIDEELLVKLFNSHDYIVTIEENVVIGGAGSVVSQLANKYNYLGRLLNLGLPDKFIEQGDQISLLKECKLDRDHLIQTINQFIQE
jgi:1-deoxy-D-xylulose-5-phosphate synthase